MELLRWKPNLSKCVGHHYIIVTTNPTRVERRLKKLLTFGGWLWKPSRTKSSMSSGLWKKRSRTFKGSQPRWGWYQVWPLTTTKIQAGRKKQAKADILLRGSFGKYNSVLYPLMRKSRWRLRQWPSLATTFGRQRGAIFLCRHGQQLWTRWKFPLLAKFRCCR